MEGTLINAREDILGQSQTLSGHLRVGSTEGFGNYVLAPLMTDFQRRFPAITLDIMPVPRFISLSKREADIAISLERPQRGPYLCTKRSEEHTSELQSLMRIPSAVFCLQKNNKH